MTDKLCSEPGNQKEEAIKVDDNLESDKNEPKINANTLFTPTEEKIILEKNKEDVIINVEKKTEPSNYNQNVLATECPLNGENSEIVGEIKSIVKNSSNPNINEKNNNNNQASTNKKVGFYLKTKSWIKQKWQNLHFKKGIIMEECLDAHGNKILLPKQKMMAKHIVNNKTGKTFDVESYDSKNKYKYINYNTYVSLSDVFSGYLY